MGAIPFNPYIVGNPIKTREMFFGREDDFQYVVRKIGEAPANQILVFCGERRSGKTSILFQILSGRLGERFLPVLVDMQILAGIRGDDEFFRAILRAACAGLALPGLTLESLENAGSSRRVQELLDDLLRAVESRVPGRIVLFLLDEYELIEEKIRDGSLSESSILYLSGLLESPLRVSFVFTGSTNLEDRRVSIWKSLLAKSIYRKISYLSRADTMRLVTEPLRDHLAYPAEVQEAIYRLTGGQPFYTQVICQNMVDRMIEEGRSAPTTADLEAIVRDVADNPLPQMIYSWNNLGEGTKLILACLGGILQSASDHAGAREIAAFLRRNRVALPFERERLNVLLEEAYHGEILEKQDDNYRFRMDLLRRWIGREHSVWKVAKEIALEFRGRRGAGFWVAVAAAGVAAALVVLWIVEPPIQLRFLAGSAPATAPAVEPPAAAAQASIEGVVLAGSHGPFRVTVDGSLVVSSEGQGDSRRIVLPSLPKGTHRFEFHSLATGERTQVEANISAAGQVVEAAFGSVAARGPAPQPQAAPPAQAAVGTLVVSSAPAGALILVDGTTTGHRTPGLVERVAVGERRVTLRLEGYREQTITLTVGTERPARAEVVLAETFGELRFDVRPAATILLDGKLLVETPYVKPVRVRSGRHVLTIVNESLAVRREREVFVNEGEQIAIEEVLR